MSEKDLKIQNDEKVVHMSFELPVELRNAFKGKIASQGRTVKEVMVMIIEEYIKSNNK
jgi:hypothetical protein